MRINLDQADQPFIHRLLGEEVDAIDAAQQPRLQQALQSARQQKSHETDLDWKRNAVYLLLFIFLYAALGASLTLDLSAIAQASSHKSIAYALEAVPVLIAFSGLFLSLLFVFATRSSARRLRNWEQSILLLEKYTGSNLSLQINDMGARTTHYSQSAVTVALALFISVTWAVMYNFFTFTTSGVIGSVISLFITTMTYVILDIQLLKSGHARAIDEPQIPAEDEKTQEKPRA